LSDSLTIVVHGESGVGKSWFADTAPGPRLVLDVEGGVRFTPSQKVTWDPRNTPPDLGDDQDASAVVPVRDLAVLQQTFQWLNAGQHPFRSVVIDSLTEAQKRAVDQIAGTAQMKTQDWGSLLRKMEQMVRAFRDLTMHPVKPLECVVFVCGTKTGEDGIARPHLQGQMGTTLPYYVDVVAHMGVGLGDNGGLTRASTFAPIGGVVAKDRTGRLGTSMTDPSIPRMFDAVYGAEAQKEA
jgi:hypothetical protein